MTKILLLLISILFITACSNDVQREFHGYIEGRFNYLASSYSGTLIKLLAQRGETVKAGQALAILEQENPLPSQTKWSYNQKTITAPIAGQIFDNYYEIGELVPPHHPILGLLAPQNVYLVFFIPEHLLNKVTTGQTIKFTGDNFKEIFSATIRFISPNAEYTPPVIYSRSNREKLVYRVEASTTPKVAKMLHPGQPIDIFVTFNN